MIKIKPDPNCPACLGTGIDYLTVPYMGTKLEKYFCDCVTTQIPEGQESEDVEIETEEE
jgi:hypothetical protein